jgi:peptidoglycan/LPS O-acetylase OafA/YrhL
MDRAQAGSQDRPLLGTISMQERPAEEGRRGDDESAAAPRIQWSRMAWSMLPWVVTAPLGKTQRKLPKVTSTSYLNGLRGVACLIVYNYHLTILFNTDLKAKLSTLPFVNLLVAGHGATMVFFVLSGFVLSYSPLSKISSPESRDSALLTSLWSSTVRRGFRLFTPLVVLALALSFITFFLPVFPAYEGLPWARVEPKTLGAFFHHLGTYAQNVCLLTDPFTWEFVQPPTLEHAWTLPFEYRGSLVVFLLSIACARLTPRCRKLLLVAFALWALYWVRWDVFCFTSGMFLAELRFQPLPRLSLSFFSWSYGSSIRHKEELLPLAATEVEEDARPRRPWAKLAHAVPLRQAVGLLALPLAILICAWPDGAAGGAIEPYASLHAVFTPAQYAGIHIDFLYASVGAVMVLASLEALPAAQWLLSTAPFRYLGEISFSFYLLHLLLIHFMTAHILTFLTGSFGWGYDSAFAVMWVLTAAGTALASDLFWRGIDESSVRISRKISDWLIAKPRDTGIAYHAL